MTAPSPDDKAGRDDFIDFYAALIPDRIIMNNEKDIIPSDYYSLPKLRAAFAAGRASAQKEFLKAPVPECGSSAAETVKLPWERTPLSANSTPRTDARLRELVIKWGRGEYADAHIIEDFTDFARQLERELAVAQAEIDTLPSHAEHQAALLGINAMTKNWQDAEKRLAALSVRRLPQSYLDNPPKDITEAVEIIEVLREELGHICVAVGRSKDGTGFDVDWFELHKDVEARSTRGSSDVTVEDYDRALDDAIGSILSVYAASVIRKRAMEHAEVRSATQERK